MLGLGEMEFWHRTESKLFFPWVFLVCSSFHNGCRVLQSSTNNVTNIASLYAQLTNLPRGGSLHRGTGPSAVHGAGKNLFEGSTESAQLARVETLRTQIAELDALCNAAGDDKFISGYLVEKRTHLSLLERRR